MKWISANEEREIKCYKMIRIFISFLLLLFGLWTFEFVIARMNENVVVVFRHWIRVLKRIIVIFDVGQFLLLWCCFYLLFLVQRFLFGKFLCGFGIFSFIRLVELPEYSKCEMELFEEKQKGKETKMMNVGIADR